MRNSSIWVIFILSCVLCLWWIGNSLFSGLEERALFQSVIADRNDYALDDDGEIIIGAAGSWEQDKRMLEGMILAAEVINQQGGILGRYARVVPGDDKGNIAGTLRVAQQFCNDPRISFVIESNPVLIEAVTQNYEFYGLLLMSPLGSLPDHAGQRFNLSLSNGLSPEQFADEAAKFSFGQGWTNIGLLYSDPTYGSRLARRFESAGDANDVICTTGVIPPMTQEGRDDLGDWLRGLAIQAVVLSASPEVEHWVMEVCRETGNVPVILAGSKSTGLGTQDGHDYPSGVHTLTSSDMKTPYEKAFADAFQKRYGHNPDHLSAAGYDALMLLAQAATLANTLEPVEVAEELKNIVDPKSVTGTMGFDENGNAIKKSLHFTSTAPTLPPCPLIQPEQGDNNETAIDS